MDPVAAMKLIRNVGVIAHIDAGKTTTTERMLYFAHRTHRLGEVDRGDTVTDYLPEERDRGISIVTAAACLTWRNHTLHLLDTPGHVDFTAEVERSLSVMDSAITILDGTKGVQAQTRTVWHQADRYRLPRLVFVNKMDRDTASLDLSLATLSAQLTSATRYVAIHWPVFSDQLIAGTTKSPSRNRFIGMVDLTSMRLSDWSKCSSVDTPFGIHELLQYENQAPSRTNPSSSAPIRPDSMRAVINARAQLMGSLADADEEFADQFLSMDHPELLLPPEAVQRALRRATLAGRIVPVLVGSSRHSIGVQPLLDGIVDYLPDPSERGLPGPAQQLMHRIHSRRRAGDIAPSSAPASAGKSRTPASPTADPVMLVFKVCFDPHRGALSLVRLYSGSISAGTMVANWSLQKSTAAQTNEKVQTVLQLTGDHREVVQRAGPGSIVALAGLQSTRSGDWLIGSASASMASATIADESRGPVDSEDEIASAVRRDPVVYAALEPASLSAVRNLEHALACMQREDSSFTARLDPETGQWAIGGMGDLHLEVVMARLKREYKVDARMGPLLIAYKECPLGTTSTEPVIVYGRGHSSGLVEGRERTFLLELAIEVAGHKKTPQMKFDRAILGSAETSGGADELGAGSQARLRQTLRQSCLSALEMGGPLLRSPVIGVNVTFRRLVTGRSTDEQPLSADTDIRNLDPRQFRFPSRLASAQAAIPLLRAATSAAVGNALGQLSAWRLMEPMVEVELRLPVDNRDGHSESLSRFLGDLSSRRAEIESVDTSDPVEEQGAGNEARYHVIRALAPLAELVGYSSTVRTLSSGRADFHLRLADYAPVSADHQNQLLSQFRWTPASTA